MNTTTSHGTIRTLDTATGHATTTAPRIPALLNPQPLSTFSYIGPDKILTEEHARTLLTFYFDYLHPFYPFLPENCTSPEMLTVYPILFCAVLTVAARYAPGASENKVHDHLWIECQKLFLNSVWGEALLRSVGTVFAFLVFTEWNPRAIHYEGIDYGLEEPYGERIIYKNAPRESGMQAMRRSTRMSWMLCGNANRLSQDMGFMDELAQVFVATHLSEITTAMAVGKSSMLQELLDSFSSKPLSFSGFQRAQIELLQAMSMAFNFLYREEGASLKNPVQVLSILRFLEVQLQNWYSHNETLLQRSDYVPNIKEGAPLSLYERQQLEQVVQCESLWFDYSYTQLYVFLLALDCGPAESSSLQTVSHFVQLAFKAAESLLNVAERIDRIHMLKYMPVRWTARIMSSVAFVVKCYWVLKAEDNSSVITCAVSISQIIPLIKRAALNLRNAAPDELHLGHQYSKSLLFLHEKILNTRETAQKTREGGKVTLPGLQPTFSKTDPYPVFTPGPPAFGVPPEPSFGELGVLEPYFMMGEGYGLDFVGSWTENLEGLRDAD